MVDIQTFTVATTAPGRADYNKSLSVTASPVVRRHQLRTSSMFRATVTAPAGDYGLIVGPPYFSGRSYAGITWSTSGYYIKTSPGYLMRVYYGFLDLLSFLGTPMTEDDLLDSTVFGPFGEQYAYGQAEVIFNSPISYVPANDWEWYYLLVDSANPVTEDITYTYEAYYMMDWYP